MQVVTKEINLHQYKIHFGECLRELISNMDNRRREEEQPWVGCLLPGILQSLAGLPDELECVGHWPLDHHLDQREHKRNPAAPGKREK